ncbi:hypothetical protein C2G38_2035294 [Gigaspora rosea]|uniref:Uncharacterized protein n=1 Tax=Gigaspora rosea TaxID=44941 RepID=A0A397VH83_9GLOM|nr:hypothetical protein C2G38_2035294 [Gigaspora rosea]
MDITTPSSSYVSSEEHQKQLNHECQKCFRNKNKKTTLHLSNEVSEDLQHLLNTEAPIVVVETSTTDNSTIVVKTSTSDSDSNSVTLEEYQKQLNRERQKRFRNKNKETASPKSIDVFKDLNTERSLYSCS